MTPFSELTEAGQARRLRSLVGVLLAHYDLDVARIRFLARATNTLFRLDLADGRRLVVRVADPHGNTPANMLVETEWLAGLADHGLPVPAVVRDRDGRAVVEVEVEGVPGPRACVVFGWVPGAPIGENATDHDYRLLGELSARLHRAGRSAPVPAAARRWDRVFYYPEDLDPVVVWDESHAGIFTPHRRALIEAVIGMAEPILVGLHTGAQLVHGDLHPWNVHRHGGHLWALDFEDVMVAAPVQDVAVSLFYNRDRADHPALVGAFRAGYESQAEWPDEDPSILPTIMAARTVMFMNYVAKDDGYDDFFERATGRLERFLAAPEIIPLMP